MNSFIVGCDERDSSRHSVHDNNTDDLRDDCHSIFGFMIIPRLVVIASQSVIIALGQNNKNASESSIQKFLKTTNII